MHRPTMILTPIIVLAACMASTALAQNSQDDPHVREGLILSPEADTGDGVLTLQEARAIMAECDVLDWITPDDPPLVLGNPEADADPKTRSQVLHSMLHARAVRAECAVNGVECIVRQDHPDPKLRAAPAAIPRKPAP